MTTLLHQSVYLCAVTNDQMEPAAWCTDVIGPGDIRGIIPASKPLKMWTCVLQYGVLDTAFDLDVVCCVFTFVHTRHKLLFDIRWGHLGIYDTAAALEADHPGTEHY